MQLQSITRRFALAALVALAAGAGPAHAGRYGQAAPAWRDTAAHLDLFAPAAHRGDYRADVSPLDLDAVLQALAADPALLRVPGAWTPRAQLPADAFGRSGTYNRWTLARLYGPRQPRVARGARLADGGVLESWTLVSPYPSADLTRLEPGTLRIVLRIRQ